MPRSVSVTQEEFERRVKERFPKEKFTVLRYWSTRTPLMILCENCGSIIMVSQAINFLEKKKKWGCKYCRGGDEFNDYPQWEQRF